MNISRDWRGNKRASIMPDLSVEKTVTLALAEDIGSGDITAQLIAESARAGAEVICRQQAILCGTAWFDEVFKQLDFQGKIRWNYRDGEQLAANAPICRLEGQARALLTGERTALNFLQTLSSVATNTWHYVQAVSGTDARILDTRKTIPGLRAAEKYAVRCGSGHNHRFGLYDGILIKENHIRAAGSIAQALTIAREIAGSNDMLLEIEVETLDELEQALAAGAKRCLLDNFSLQDLRAAVAKTGDKAKLEASGGVSLSTVKHIAETGVDDISVGDITKNIDAIDLSMLFDSDG